MLHGVQSLQGSIQKEGLDLTGLWNTGSNLHKATIMVAARTVAASRYKRSTAHGD